MRLEACPYQSGTVLVSQTSCCVWGDDNNDTGGTGYTLMSRHLILAVVEFVNDYLPKICQHWHLCFSASVCASFFFFEVCWVVHSGINCAGSNSI